MSRPAHMRRLAAVETEMTMQLHGMHHLTAVTADAWGNHDFYTRVLGMRLVKKTVNQDDVSAYHLFYTLFRSEPENPWAR